MKMTALLKSQLMRYVLLTVSMLAVIGLELPHPAQPSTSAQQQAIAVVNAASFASDSVVSPETIVAVFGQFRTQDNQTFFADTIPLPTTLGGIKITVNGVAAGLLAVSPGQINMVIPADTIDGQATVIVTSVDDSTKSGNCLIVRSYPGIFTAKANGSGAPAGQTTFDGVNFQSVSNPDGSERDVDPGTRERPNFLVLYLTGLRHAPAANPGDANGVAEAVTVSFLGVPGQVLYAGPTPGFAGLDQINVRIPWELGGLGLIPIKVLVNSAPNPARESNIVAIRLAGQHPLVIAAPISANQVVNGALTYEDQLQEVDGNIFFFDAYLFETTADNVPVAIDLRSNQFDAEIILYRIENDQLVPIASDDEAGGYGDENNHNSLLLTFLAARGQYVLLATTSDFNPLGIGNYSIEIRTNPPIQAINYGANLTSASFASGDLQNSAGTYLDVYTFNGQLGDRVEVFMRSTALDSLLLLQQNNDNIIAADDNSGGGTDARIEKVLPETGRYLIIATPFEPNKTGAYSLTLNRINTFAGSTMTTTSQLSIRPSRFVRDLKESTDLQMQSSSFERAARRRIISR